MNKKLQNAFAMSAAAMFLAACGKSGEAGGADAPSAGQASAKIKCMGVNECKGQGACDTATHSCAGQNECKGKGWVLATADECQSKGGQVVQ